MEQPDEPCSIQSLPIDSFSLIACQLSPSELAALSVQNRRLRDQASSNELWRPHCLQWWPHAEAAVELYYSGDWHRMFCDRAAMPAAFPASVDKIHVLTSEAKNAVTTLPENDGRFAANNEPNTEMELILRGVEAVKRAVQLTPEIQYTMEYASLRIDISWWLAEHPQAAVKFAKTATENLYTSISTGQGRRLSTKCDAEWKLDALEGMSSLALEQRVHLSVRRRLNAEVSTLRRLVEAQA